MLKIAVIALLAGQYSLADFVDTRCKSLNDLEKLIENQERDVYEAKKNFDEFDPKDHEGTYFLRIGPDPKVERAQEKVNLSLSNSRRSLERSQREKLGYVKDIENHLKSTYWNRFSESYREIVETEGESEEVLEWKTAYHRQFRNTNFEKPARMVFQKLRDYCAKNSRTPIHETLVTIVKDLDLMDQIESGKYRKVRN